MLPDAEPRQTCLLGMKKQRKSVDSARGVRYLSTMNGQHNEEDSMGNENGFWSDADVISTYSRAQAIEDGVLVEMPTDLAREAGFRYPIALTADAWEQTVSLSKRDEEMGQDVTGRLWDIMTMMRFTMRSRRGKGPSDRVRFQVIVMHGRRRRLHNLEAICGPGDDAEPVITIDVAA